MREAATITIIDLIRAGYDAVASDVLIKTDSKPKMKQHSFIEDLPGEWPVLQETDIARLVNHSNLFPAVVTAIGGRTRVICDLVRVVCDHL